MTSPFESFEQSFPPPADGRARLKLRIDAAARRERREISALKLTSAALVLCIGAFSAWSPSWGVPTADFEEARSILSDSASKSLSNGAIQVNASTLEVRDGTPGVRFYWVFR